MEKMPDAGIPLEGIRVWRLKRGCRIELPMKTDEIIYGLGLQCKNLIQNGRSNRLLTAPGDDAKGAGHAPVLFYVNTAGYGVLIDNARFMTFSIGAKQRLVHLGEVESPVQARKNITDEALLYGEESREGTSVYVDVPAAEGVDIYLFAGPRIGDAVARYNLYSGGGFIPSMAGLAPEYLVGTMLKEEDALSLCESFGEDRIPVASVGLEPGWQTHAYSSSYIWNRDNFSEEFVGKAQALGYGVTLWCQLYLDPTSPLIAEIGNKFGDFEVWRGFVPDMLDPQVRDAYRDFLLKNFIGKGIAGLNWMKWTVRTKNRLIVIGCFLSLLRSLAERKEIRCVICSGGPGRVRYVGRSGR